MASSSRTAERPALPAPNFPEQLPVSARRDEIARAIAAHPVLIVCGETGSGKTTQLPKIAWMAGRGRRGLIGHTQPRRLAATSVARRIAQELGSPLGTHVGYKIRFNEAIAPSATVKLMTDGVLLAETQSDPQLRRYDTIIVDEAHERSLNIDFLLGYLKELLAGPRRDDLRLVITSATIDAERFAAHFAYEGRPAPVIEVSGRLYPVEIRYLPLAAAARGAAASPVAREGAGEGDGGGEADADEPQDAETDEVEASLPEAVEAAIAQLWREGPGDVLVFLPGEREIRDCMEHLSRVLADAPGPPAELLPLFARLSASEQERVFTPSSAGRRVVLATNVAETSLTVPGVRYVVDSGLARVKRYRYRGKVEQLLVEPVSQAAANQRAGRCGRVANGVCIRLYDQADFERRARFTDPEVLRSSLAAVILRMKSLRLTEVERFPFVDPPPRRAIVDGYELLHELNAIDDAQALTPIGRKLARLPVDPRIGRMLLAGHEQGCLAEVLVVASALAVQDPRERPLDARPAADRAHARFVDERSDFLSLLRLWRYCESVRTGPGSRRARDERLKREFISPRRLREWTDVRAQLAEAVGELGWKAEASAGAGTLAEGSRAAQQRSDGTGSRATPGEPGPGADETPAPSPAMSPQDYARLHRALLAGLLGNLGMRAQEGDHFVGTHGVRFWLHPGSGVGRRGARWVMAAELVQTQRLFARTVARIEPGWIEKAAAHLIRRSWSEPHWEKRPAQVVAFERGVLYGLPLYAQRRVHYGPRDPALARELLIRGALVAGDWDTRLRFFAHNRRLIEEIEALEQRMRRPDLLVDDQTLFEFYDAQLPPQVITGAAFEAWYREASRSEPRLLFLERDLLLRRELAGTTGEDFPHLLAMRGVEYEVEYRFEPGTPTDGATLRVPLHALNQVDAVRCEWEVPGLLREKVIALVKSLPQRPRHRCQPHAEFADAFIARAREAGWRGERPLAEALADYVRERVHLPVQAADMRSDAIPAHLQLRIAVLDEYGREMAAARNLASLRARYAQAAREQFRALAQAAPVARAAGPAVAAEATPAAAAATTPHVPAPPPAADTVPRHAGERFTDWGFGPLPELLELERRAPDGSVETLVGFPALLDRGDAVELQVFDEPEVAERTHRVGLRRLFAIALREPLRHFERNIPDFTRLGVRFAAFGGADDLRAQLVEGTIERCCMADPLPDAREAFEARVAEARPRVNLVGQEFARLAGQILEEYASANARLAQVKAHPEAAADITDQLAHLMGKRFLVDAPQARLMHYPRYLKAIALRIEKLRGDPARDRERLAQLAPLVQGYRRAVAARKGRPDPGLEEFRWLLEELRVSLFAQELRTPSPVSVKRLQRAWEALSR